MGELVKNRPRKRLYKIWITKEGDRKTRHINYVWARSAREAQEITKAQKRKTGEKVLEIRAGAVG